MTMFTKMMKRITYARTVRTLNSLTDKQLEDVGISRDGIKDRARQVAS